MRKPAFGLSVGDTVSDDGSHAHIQDYTTFREPRMYLYHMCSFIWETSMLQVLSV